MKSRRILRMLTRTGRCGEDKLLPEASLVKNAWSVPVLVCLNAAFATAVELPAGYYRIMEAGCASVEKHLDEQPDADLNAIEQRREPHTGSSLEINWAHFGYAILPPAVLYAKQHPANWRYHDPHMLGLALRIGDLLAKCRREGNLRAAAG